MDEKTDRDSELFLDEVRDVKPLKRQSDRVSPKRHFNPSAPKLSEEENVDRTSFMRPGVQRSELRALRKGDVPIEDQLDLHGYTAAEAENELRNFVLTARASGRRRVRVIHGKGLGSANQKSVLKDKTYDWLTRSDAVLAFCEAGPAHGGTGAVHVLLKRR